MYRVKKQFVHTLEKHIIIEQYLRQFLIIIEKMDNLVFLIQLKEVVNQLLKNLKQIKVQDSLIQQLPQILSLLQQKKMERFMRMD